MSQTTQPSTAEKVCRICETPKPLSEYYVRRDGDSVRHRSECKKCIIHKIRKKNTGASEEDYQRLFSTQGGVCAICGSTTNALFNHFAVDHCHTTGSIRGLLCTQCNTGLGMFRDDPLRLSKAIAYLEKSRS